MGGGVHGGVHRGALMEMRLTGLTARPVGETHDETIHLPAPTVWPILMALGVVLIFFSLVTTCG